MTEDNKHIDYVLLCYTPAKLARQLKKFGKSGTIPSEMQLLLWACLTQYQITGTEDTPKDEIHSEYLRDLFISGKARDSWKTAYDCCVAFTAEDPAVILRLQQIMTTIGLGSFETNGALLLALINEGLPLLQKYKDNPAD